jgi:hypothetical protein
VLWLQAWEIILPLLVCFKVAVLIIICCIYIKLWDIRWVLNSIILSVDTSNCKIQRSSSHYTFVFLYTQTSKKIGYKEWTWWSHTKQKD